MRAILRQYLLLPVPEKDGGLLYTCGLDVTGRVEGHDLHGTLHNTPAEIVFAGIVGDELVVEANVRVTTLFGQNLVFNRKVVSKIGEDDLTLNDTLINEGYANAEYCILYHINVGYPMLDEGAKIKLDYSKIYPCNDWANKNVETAGLITDCVPSQDEMCYYYDLVKPEVSLVNEKLNKTLTVKYSQDTLPCFLQWKSMASGDYALGIEPCSSKVGSNLKRKTIKAQEKVEFTVNIKISKE